jgi:hypothetical protein
MAHDEKRFSALGRDWVARFDFNSICAIEESTGQPFLKVVAPLLSQVSVEEGASAHEIERAALAAMVGLKLSDIRMILYQSLLGAQPTTTPVQAGEIIEDVGLQGAMEIVSWAIVKAMPNPKVSSGNGGSKKENTSG